LPVLLRFPTISALSFALALGSLGGAANSQPAPAGPIRLSLVPYAALYSLQTKAPDLIDPWMFVSAPGAPPATALQQLAHAAGIRNALMSDDGTLSAFDANGKQLGFSLQRWFGASGLIELSPESVSGEVPIVAHLVNLVPNGRYTLLVVRFTARPIAFSPLEGTVTAASWFTAGSDGSASAEFSVPGPLGRQSAIELVYHSDRSITERGLMRADLGIDAHVQAIARVR
jgi:hypothetical protein